MSIRLTAGLVGLMFATSALAADVAAPALPAAPSALDFAFGAKFMSDYNFRGISQTARQPGATVFAEGRLGIAYAGLSFWTTRLPNRPAGEVDIFAGIRPQFGPVTVDLGLVYYAYVPERQRFDGLAPVTPRDTDFLEVYARPSWDINDQVNLGVNLFHTRNWLGSGSPGTYASLTGRVKLPHDFAISGEIGRYWFSNATTPSPYRPTDYTYWNAGVSWTTQDSVTLDLRYHGTSMSPAQCAITTGDPRSFSTGATPGRSSWCGHSVVATLSVDLLWSKLKVP